MKSIELRIDNRAAQVLMSMDEEARHQCLDALMMFAFFGEDVAPENAAAAVAYGFLKIDIARRAESSEDGKRGGRPCKSASSVTESIQEPPEAEKRFTPPTTDEVAAYCKSRDNGIDAAHFVDYYTSVGWKVGGKRMKDWKSAVRTWEAKNRTRSLSRSTEAADTLRAALLDVERRE